MRYGNKSDVLFAQHHWPTWGQARINEYLADQRDMYAFLNDQTLRLLNQGLTPGDIADRLRQLPDSLARKWYTRDYYGTISHNVRAIYQRYLGFYDGNPANLNPLPPVEAARRTVEWMGGAAAVLAKAQAAFERGEYRWVAQIVNQVIFADPENGAARRLQADALEQLGYQSESSTWRNAYLTGAQELRNGVMKDLGSGSVSPDMVRALTVPLFFDYLGVRLNGDKATGQEAAFNWIFTDINQKYAPTMRHSALTYLADQQHREPTATVTLTKATLDSISLGQLTVADAMKNGSIRVDGDAKAVSGLFAILDKFSPNFDIVTPQAPD